MGNHKGRDKTFFGLLQFGALRPGFFQDGNLRVGVFPESKEVFVGGECADAGGVAIGWRDLV
jgi:hypothetical protein